MNRDERRNERTHVQCRWIVVLLFPDACLMGFYGLFCFLQGDHVEWRKLFVWFTTLPVDAVRERTVVGVVESVWEPTRDQLRSLYVVRELKTGKVVVVSE